MTAVTASIEVARPAAEVFAYATDPGTFHEWQKGVVSGPQDTSGTGSVGDRCVTTRRIGFADRPITSEVIEVDPPRVWTIQGVDGPIRARVDVAVDAVDEQRSRLTITLDFTGHGMGRVLVPLVVVPEARREMPGNLERLRAHVESRR